MRRQNKAVAVVAQPNLFNMWNATKRAHENKVEDKDECDSRGMQGSVTHSTGVEYAYPMAQPHGGPSNDSMLTHATQDDIANRLYSSGASDMQAVATGGEKEDHINGESIATSSCSENVVTGGSVGGSILRRLKGRTASGRNQTGGIPNSDLPQKLFPIFGRKDDQPSNGPTAESNLSGDKKEPCEPKQKTGKATIRSTRSKTNRRTTSEYLNPPLEIAHDGTTAGPSSQPSLDLQNTVTESRNAKGPPGSSFRLTTGESQDKPIIIDSSPVRDVFECIVLESSPSPTKPRRSARGDASRDFFAPRKQSSPLSPAKFRKKVGEGDFAKWPDKDSQHVRGAQRSFPSGFPGATRPQPKTLGEDLSTRLAEPISHLRIGEASRLDFEPKYLIEPIGAQPDGHARCERILQSKATCPAISRFLKADYDISGSSWNERWRPQCANEVIGNEIPSIYLRDWLLALEIKSDGRTSARDTEALWNSALTTAKVSQGTKRPQVIRAVDKPRKRRKKVESDEESLGEWLTNDDEEESPVLPSVDFETEEEFSDDAEPGSPWKPKLTRLSRRHPPICDDLDIKTNDNPPAIPTPGHDFSDRLTNTILLAGPTGTGKTAAVYACAEELGWEVFEVYPGIGKRNGASLLSLVGDVGKNHIVNRSSRTIANTHAKDGSDSNTTSQTSAESKVGRRKTIPDTFTSFFRQEGERPARDAFSDSVEAEQVLDEPRERDPSHAPKLADTRASLDVPAANGRASAPVENLDSRGAGAQQSIILLEEVDILFSEDVNFWPTVVALIRESRRPVIMTCNDPTLIPSANLPLQTILSFKPCPSDLAISYLQCMALTEGYSASEAHVKSLYNHERSLDPLGICDGFLRSSAYPLSAPDLRRAINSSQFLCQGSPGFNQMSSPTGSGIKCPNPPAVSALDELYVWDWSQHFTSDYSCTIKKQSDVHKENPRGIRDLWRISDSLSMVDSYLARKPSSAQQMTDYAARSPADDELGYPCLGYEPEVSHLQDGIILYNYDEAIAREAVICAGKTIGNNATCFGTELIRDVRTDERWKPSFPELLRSSSGHFERVSGVLRKIVPATIRQSVGALILDYEPWVRTIDRSDMLLEVAALKETETRTGARGGRTTRNSQRMQYQRYFDLEEEERKVWQGNGLSKCIEATFPSRREGKF